MGQALAGGLRAQGYSDSDVEETVFNLLSDIEVKAVDIYATLHTERKTR